MGFSFVIIEFYYVILVTCAVSNVVLVFSFSILVCLHIAVL